MKHVYGYLKILDFRLLLKNNEEGSFKFGCELVLFMNLLNCFISSRLFAQNLGSSRFLCFNSFHQHSAQFHRINLNVFKL